MPAVLNAANEVAVAAFLERGCPFAAITDAVAATLEVWAARNRPLATLEQAFAADRDARRIASEYLDKHMGSGLRPEV